MCRKCYNKMKNTSFSTRSFLISLSIALCISIWIAHLVVTHYIEPPVIYKLVAARYQINRAQKNIIFVEPDGAGRLNPRQVCAIESAVRSNPDWSVHVLFYRPITNATGLRALEHFPNLKYSRLWDYHMSRRTPYETIFKFYRMAYNNSYVRRYLANYNLGGIYVDMDILVVRSLNQLKPTWVVRLPNNLFSGSIFSIAWKGEGRDIAALLVREVSHKLEKYEVNNAKLNLEDLPTDVLTDTIKTYCRTSFPPEMSPNSCPGLHIYDKKEFPLSQNDMQAVLMTNSLINEKYYPFVLNMKSRPDLETLITQRFPDLAEEYCPTAYQEYGFDSFISK